MSSTLLTAGRSGRTLLTSAGLLLLLAGSAVGQDVLVNGFPSVWSNPNGAGNPTGLPNSFRAGNTSGIDFDDLTIGGTRSSVRLVARGTATEDGVAPADRLQIQMVANQDFRVADRGVGTGVNLWAPTFFAGAINFFNAAVAPNANNADARLYARVEFLRFDGTSYVPFAAPVRQEFTLNRTAAQGNQGLDQTRILELNDPQSRAVADQGVGGRYRLQAFLEVRANARAAGAAASDVGSGATASAAPENLPQNTPADLARGLITSLGYAPSEALPNSRAAVGAVYAKDAFKLDGRNVRIGQVEAGRPWQTAPGLAGAKVEQLRERLNMPNGLTSPADPAGPLNPTVADSRSEHATAVAGIMAGSAGDNEQRGIASGAQVVSAPVDAFSTNRAAFDAVALDRTVQIVNMSAGPDEPSPQYVDSVINARRNLVFVKSAGNSGQGGAAGNPANTITNPGMNYNGIAVGGLNARMTSIASYSSNNSTPGELRKPDLVAPSEYVLAPMAIDTNNDGTANDFDRRLTGVDARVFASADNSYSRTGSISGTSFAAPHVAGVAALMSQMQRENRGGGFDADSDDSRVVKAVLLNTATRRGFTDSGGNAWRQRTNGSVVGAGYTVTESLDRELGAGMVNAFPALKNYLAGEALASDNNTVQNFNITPAAADGKIKTEWWDLEHVAGAAVGPPAGGALPNGTVNYALPTTWKITDVAESGERTGTVIPGFDGLKAALTWNRGTNLAGDAYTALSNLELRLYLENPITAINKFGFDPDLGGAILLAQTSNAAENSKLFDLDGLRSSFFSYSIDLTRFGDVLAWQPRFFLQVVNLSANATDYGLSVIVPTPGLAGLLIGGGVLAARRRR